MDDRSTYFEDPHSCDLPAAGRSRDLFLQLRSMQDQLQSQEVQFFRSADPIDVQVTQDPETEKRHAIRSQGDQEDHLHRFISGWTQGLSLTLGPRRRPARSECMLSEREGSAICTAKTSNGSISHSLVSVSSMSSVLQQSRFLKPAQELLDEVVSVSSAVELSFDEDPRKVRPFGVITNRIGGISLEVGERTKCLAEENSPDADVRIVKLVALLDEVQIKLSLTVLSS